MSGFPVLHCFLEFVQIHVHGVGDTIQPSHSLLLSSPALNFSQHQDFSVEPEKSGGQSTGVSASASALPMNIQG